MDDLKEIKIGSHRIEIPKKMVRRVLIEMIKQTLHDDGFPKIICLCGSTKFKEEFIAANFHYTMLGYIVLSVGWFSHSDKEKYYPNPAEKAKLDDLHKRKIDLADEVVVVHRDRYIGESTKSEINYARELGKPVWMFSPLNSEGPINERYTETSTI